jgi:uncharacterized protein
MDRFGDWIITSTGRQFWPLDPHPDDVRVEDIAHALAKLCRWTGHCDQHVSVAQHARIVAHTVSLTHPELELAALHHDSAEAYIGDIARPLKRSLLIDTGQAPSHVMAWLTFPSASIKLVEYHLLQVIFQALGIPWPDNDGWQVIHSADNAVLMTEYRDCMPKHGPAFAGIAEQPLAMDLRVYEAQVHVEADFLMYHDRLIRRFVDDR